MNSNINFKCEKDGFIVEVSNDSDLMLIEVEDMSGSKITLEETQYFMIKDMVDKLIYQYESFPEIK